MYLEPEATLDLALTDRAWALRNDDPVRARALAEEVLGRAGEHDVLRARSLSVLSFLVFREHCYDDALSQAFEALGLFEKIQEETWRSRLLNVIAGCHDYLGERFRALELHQ